MYVIIVYDIKVERVNKVKSFLRQYLFWIQNSVFEGEISEVKLKELLMKAELFIEKEEDSIILFKGQNDNWMEKQIVGKVSASPFSDGSKLDN